MKWSFLLLSCLAISYGQDDDAFVEVSCLTGSDGFDYDVVINDELNFQYSLTVTDDVEYFTAKLTYSGVGWVGWALSPDGNMIGSSAVIGLPGDSVLVYDLTGKDVDLVIPSDTQDIIDTAITQTDTETVLEFSRPVDSVNGAIDVYLPQYFLFAYREGRDTLSTHSTRGYFYLALTTCDDIGLGTAAPTSSPVEIDVSCTSDNADFENLQQITDDLAFYWTLFEVDNEEFIKVRMVYSAEGWAAWALSPDGEMKGHLAVLGLPDVGVDYYDLNGYSTSAVEIRDDSLQTLTDNTVVQENGVTTIDFTRSLAADAEGDLALSSTSTDLYIWAVRTDNQFEQHTSKGSVYMNFGDCTAGVLASLGIVVEVEVLTDAQKHGVIMMVVWFGMAPIAIILARYFRRWKGWFYAHIALQASGLSLVIVGLVLAMKLEAVEDNHFSGVHGRLGLAIVIGMILQIIIATFRPHVRPETVVSNLDDDTSIPPRSPQNQGQAKSYARLVWEIKHRVLGAFLVVAAIYNINLGIELPAAETTSAWDNFWLAMVISLACLFLILEAARCLKPDSFSPRVVQKSMQVPLVISPQPKKDSDTISNRMNDPLIR